MALEAGQRIGDYEVQSLLGTGGMGRVYRVRNVISDRVEAMKVLLPDYASEPELAARFTAEIRTLATLEHPNIAQLRTAFQFENQLVMVMEFVEGSTLDQLASQSRIPLNLVLEYAMQVLSALSYAHGRGITHRDIKPSNIMVTAHGLAKLMDFGIAKSGGDLQLTRPGTTMGSVYYMSPEQVRGGTVDARSDLYSFGVTLYELVTGNRPFQADTSFTVLNAQLNETPKPPIEVNPSLPPALNSIILCAMAKEPTDRFQSADAFRNAIKATQDALQFPTTATPQPQGAFQASPQPQQQPFRPQSQPNQPQGGFAPVAVPPIPQPASKNRRTLWMALGAVAALIAIAAAATLLPRMLATHAGQRAETASANVSDAQPQSAATTSSSTPTPAATATPTPSPQDATPAPPPDVTQPAAASPTPSPSAEAATPTPASENHSPSHRATAGGHQREPYTSRGPASAPANDVPAQSASAPASANAAPSAQEFRTARDRYANLGARADAAKSGVQSIRSQQQAQGLDLRGDILAALSSLNNDLNESNLALTQNDLETANQYMDRADRELGILEKFLGR
ncbi:MAG TPA: protein kinase [Acidobacteriaceae bacterium]|nr:protein kinase [Acidobacteriaceae bacterium]